MPIAEFAPPLDQKEMDQQEARDVIVLLSCFVRYRDPTSTYI